jgi:hypothetical protein
MGPNGQSFGSLAPGGGAGNNPGTMPTGNTPLKTGAGSGAPATTSAPASFVNSSPPPTVAAAMSNANATNINPTNQSFGQLMNKATANQATVKSGAMPAPSISSGLRGLGK